MAFIPPGEFERRNRSNNFANDILGGSAALLAREYQAGRLDSIRLARLESTLVDLSNAQGGMERIANTPLPYPYVYFPRLFITLFCLIVPVGPRGASWHCPRPPTPPSARWKGATSRPPGWACTGRAAAMRAASRTSSPGRSHRSWMA